jgi:hypothetical protein
VSGSPRPWASYKSSLPSSTAYAVIVRSRNRKNLICGTLYKFNNSHQILRDEKETPHQKYFIGVPFAIFGKNFGDEIDDWRIITHGFDYNDGKEWRIAFGEYALYLKAYMRRESLR